jgi:PKD repeat protein
MKKILYFLFAVCCMANSYSQKKETMVPCATDELMKASFEKNPQLKRLIDLMDNEAIKNLPANRTGGGTTYTIPVVVYVVHDGGVSDISDAQVTSQINVLNEYFLGTGINFCLATKAGNSSPIPMTSTTPAQLQPIPGIIHYNNPSASNNFMSDPSPLMQIPQYSIEFTKYLRIWVVNSIDGNGSGGGTLGYSAFPNSMTNFDGIVMRSDVFGDETYPNLLYNYGQGKVLAHEVGHYLGLYHPFRGGCEDADLDCTTHGDLLCDTPPTAAANFSCSVQNSCTGELPSDSTDDIQNHMDYGNDYCRSHFTTGQINRMLFFLTQYRPNLFTNENRVFTGACEYNNMFTAAFTTSTNNACAGSPITFTSQFVQDATYLWNFGDGTTSTLQNPTKTYTGMGSTNTMYNVSLTITRTLGGDTVTETATKEIVITFCAPINNSDSNYYTGWSSCMKFNTGVPVLDQTFPDDLTHMYVASGAMQSNTSGNLLFYTQKTKVFNNQHVAINSVDLMTQHNCAYDEYSTVIVPNPSNSLQYYIFTNTNSCAPGYTDNGFRWHAVNISGTNATMGAIRQAVTTPAGYVTNPIDNAVSGGSAVTAIRNCSGNGYWIIAILKKGTASYMVVYSFTGNGVITFVSEYQLPPNNFGTSGLKASPNGNKLFMFQAFGFGVKSYLLDFDKAGGLISNIKEIKETDDPVFASGSLVRGATFSPDSNLLYTGSIYGDKIVQYNLNSLNISRSKVVVGSMDTGKISTQMALGPDKKIYVAKVSPLGGTNRSISVIHQPNALGSALQNQTLFTNNGPYKNFGSYQLSYSLPLMIDAKQATAYFPSKSSNTISKYVEGCNTYKFFPNYCGTSFKWTFTNDDTGVSVISTQNTPTYAFPGNGTYSIVLRNGITNTLIGSDSLTITDFPNPVITGSQYACQNNENHIQTMNSTVLTEGQTALWSITGGAGTISGPTNTAEITVIWSSLPGQLTLAVTQPNGCVTTVTKTIAKLCSCECIASNYFTTSIADNTVQFSVANDNPSEFCSLSLGMKNWDFGDGHYSMDESPIHTYATTGTFTVTLITSATQCGGYYEYDVEIDSMGKMVKPINKPSDIVIYPNPTSSTFSINLTLENDDRISIIIRTIEGKLLVSEDLDLLKGIQNIEFALPSNIAKGTYLIEINNSDAKTVKRLIVE